MPENDPLPVTDDGLICPKVGSWTEIKHDHVAYYAKLFSSGMKHKWGKRIYLDLYAGAGYSKIRDSSRIIPGSPLRALLLPDAFDRYVFCEEDAAKLGALRSRAQQIAPTADIRYIPRRL